MGRKSRHHRRRRDAQPFHIINVHDMPGADMRQIADKARRGRASLRLGVDKQTRTAKINEHAVKEAEDLTEVFFPHLTRRVTANELVNLLHAALFRLGLVAQDFSRHSLTDSIKHLRPPVIRCHVQDNNKTGASRAHVVVRSLALAASIAKHSPIQLGNMRANALVSTRRDVLSSVNSRTMLRDGLDCPTFRVGRLQPGHLVTDTLFLSSWNSYGNFHYFPSSLDAALHSTGPNSIDRMDASLELNAIRRVLSITTTHTFNAYMATPDNVIKRTLSRLRIEIPFRSIYGVPCLQCIRGDPTIRVFCIPISAAPLIFRAQDVSLRLQFDTSFWDVTSSNAKPVHWVRTVEPTATNAFSEASAIRFIVDKKHTLEIIRKLRSMGLAPRYIPNPVVVAEHREPNGHSIDTVLASQRLHFSFDVRYMVACILGLGVFDARGMDATFWGLLRTVEDDTSLLNVLQLMYVYGSGTAFHAGYDAEIFERLIDHQYDAHDVKRRAPVPVLRNCMQMCGIKGVDDGTGATVWQGSADSSPSGSRSSDTSDDIEDFLVEETLRGLREDKSSICNPEKSQFTRRLLTGTEMDTTSNTPTRRAKHEAKIRRVLVTPMRVIAHPAEPDLLNRVLRQYPDHQHRFIRLSFCDEDGSKYSHVSSNDLCARARAVLREGVPVAGETFVFLAFSNSQLREHGTWMYNETPNPRTDVSTPPTADEIRRWMGDFSDIRIPGKFASRQGQAFSSTVSTVDLADQSHLIIPDILDSSGKYMFSDGIGIMKRDVAKRVARKLGLKSEQGLPSAFQVRFGGAKGMLTVWDEAFPKNVDPSVRVVLHASMNKFDCTHKAIEVVGYSKRMPMFLNRQIIMLLSGHGVPDEPFEKQQNRVLRNLDRAMEIDGAHYAMRLLRFGASGSDDGGDVKLFASGTGTNMESFFRAGLNCVNCKHLFNMMYAFRRRTIGDLIKRARIPIDQDKGLCALGVLDELGVLKAREIFCQYKDPRTGELIIVEGKVTVGRSPCLHPGDIQPLTAVDRPELRHLVDVIVFPCVGHRPLPSMLCGGDLDGDIYFCIFDKTIELPKRDEIKAMNYSPPAPRTLSRDVTASDVADFFVDFIKNDRVGPIATGHVVNTDKLKDGIFSKECLQLAMHHSTAVDFPKTGVPVSSGHLSLLPRHAAKMYPDFMGKHAKVSYRSVKLLGKLYRACNAHVSAYGELNSSSFIESDESAAVQKIFYDIIGEEDEATGDMMNQARDMCMMYNTELSYLMQQYGVECEGEVISGHVGTFPDGLSRNKGGQQHYTLQMRLNRQVSNLRQRFRDEFYVDVSPSEEASKVRKAAAWYRACDDVAMADEREQCPVLVSFPWVVSDVLLSVLKRQLKQQS